MRPLQSAPRTRFANVFGKREVELLAIRISDAGLLEKEFTRAQVLAGDRDGTLVYGFDLALEWRFLFPVPGTRLFVCSKTMKDRTKAALEKDKAEGVTL